MWVTIILLLLVGFLLVFVELFIPGGIVGLIGAVLMTIAVWLCFEQYGPHQGIAVLFISILATITLVIFFFKRLPHSTVGQWIILGEENSKEKGYHSDSFLKEELLGKEGISESKLRPAGIAQIEGKRFDVVTEGDFIEPNNRIRVIQVDANRIVVVRV